MNHYIFKHSASLFLQMCKENTGKVSGTRNTGKASLYFLRLTMWASTEGIERHVTMCHYEQFLKEHLYTSSDIYTAAYLKSLANKTTTAKYHDRKCWINSAVVMTRTPTTSVTLTTMQVRIIFRCNTTARILTSDRIKHDNQEYSNIEI